MFKTKVLLISILSLIISFHRAVSDEIDNYSDCGTEYGKIASVSLNGCAKEEERCVLKRGTNATIDINFTAEKNSDELEVEVYGLILGVPMPFDMPNSNACLDSGIECPLKAGSEYTYTTSIPVLKSYPKVTVDVKLLLQKEEDVFTCIIIPAKLQ